MENGHDETVRGHFFVQFDKCDYASGLAAAPQETDILYISELDNLFLCRETRSQHIDVPWSGSVDVHGRRSHRSR